MASQNSLLFLDLLYVYSLFMILRLKSNPCLQPLSLYACRLVSILHIEFTLIGLQTGAVKIKAGFACVLFPFFSIDISCMSPAYAHAFEVSFSLLLVW